MADRTPKGHPGARSRRTALGIALVVLLLAICAVPVLAAPAQEAPATGASGGADEIPAPSPAEVAAVEAKRREEEEWLASPQAVHERLVSEDAYSEMTAGEARSLINEAFPETMAALNENPGRVLTHLDIENRLGTYAAIVGNGHGEERSLVESSVPVESSLGGEGEKPVDLNLERSGAGFVPANPITQLELPGTAQDSIELGEELKVGLPATGDHEAIPLGEENLFIPETETSTDTLLSPIADGVEISEQLRSEESPEVFSFNLELPHGAQVTPSGRGGAEIVSAAGALLGKIPPPSAVDAQGASVPVELRVNEEGISMRVPHRPSAEIAYPILADPEILWEPGNFQAWGAEPGEGYGLRDLGSSLNAYSESNRWYSANTHAAWVYTAAGETAYIAAGYFSPVDFVDPCQAYQPHGYIGLYNVATGGWPSLGIFSGGNSESTFETGWVGTPWTRYATIGIATAEQKAEDTPCFHEIYVGGALVQEKDLGPPTLNYVSGVPGGWFDPAEVGPATISTSDSGFGLHKVSAADIGGDTSYDRHECTGVYGSRCPLTDTWTIRPAYAEGERTFLVSVEDPIGQTTEWTTTTKVDLGKPEIEFGGQLAYVTEEEGPEEPGLEHLGGPDPLSLPVYNLHVKATDGSNATAREKQSGVKRVAVYLDGTLKEEWPGPACPQSSCPVEGKYTLRLTGLSGGVHNLKVVAEDWVHHLREREIEFEYLPATGENDEYVMQHFPLEVGEEGSGHGPELAVNLMNGNLVYHEQDLDLDMPSADLQVERQYNSETPDGESDSLGTGWSLAQVPTLEEAGSQQGGSEGIPVTLSGSEGPISFSAPREVGGERFEPSLHRVITTLAKGRYELSGEAGQEFGTTVFDAAGAPEKQITGGYSQIGYAYEDGRLAAMVAEDPAATEASVAETEEAEGAGAPGHPVYEESFGLPGTGAGEISSPGGMALDSSGNLWITDEESDRIEEFNREGGLVREFGSPGIGAGDLLSPGGLTVDHQGDVWVADCGNTRIEEFGPEGEYLHQFPVTGTTGGLSASSVPSGVVVGAGGNLWVSDKGAGKVDLFTPSGELIKSVGAESLQEPGAITTGPEGTMWVTDSALDEVFEFDGSGTQVTEFGSEGEGEGQFRDPNAIAVDGDDHVWVADTGNGRVEEFEESGRFLHEFGSEGEVAGRFSHPAAVASDGEDHVWVVAVGNDGADVEDTELPVELEGSEGSDFDDPVAAYSFDEGEGTTAGDLTGDGHTATIHGARWTAHGRYGGAIEFEGEEGEYLSVPDSPDLDLAEEFTLEAWVRPQGYNRWAPIVGKQMSPDENPYVFDYFLADGDSTPGVAYGGTANSEGELDSGEALPEGTWSHVAVTYDGIRLRLYVNGELVGEEASAQPPVTEGGLLIGGDAVTEAFFDGRIDEVRIYNRVLDKGEVQADMEAPLQTPTDDPVAAYSFDEGEGTTAGDLTGDGHTATIHGARWTAHGRYGGAIEFEGEEGEYLSVPDSPDLDLAEEFTLEAWVRPQGYNRWAPIVGKQMSPDENPYVFDYFLADGDSTPGVAYGGTANSEGELDSGEALPEGTWSHVAVTYDGIRLRLYVNGELVGEEASAQPPVTEGGLLIGGDAVTEAFFDGRIDEVRIYNRVLDKGEVDEDLQDPVNSKSTPHPPWQIQKWGVMSGAAPGPVDGADPEVAFSTEDGQIIAIEPSQGPEQQYQYEGHLLAAHTGPEGEATYEYDAHGRLDKVSLPNSATAEITYESIGRVNAVTVQMPGQTAKTTHFEYSDEPRETVVRLPEEPAMVYDIGADGSVFRWHNIASPPEIESLSGSLWEQRGENQTGTITPGDQNLLVHAHSAEGISSIKIVAAGNQLVEEETCEQDYEKPGAECINVPIEFVTETESWSPGVTPFEVIVTDSLGHTESRRFWVNVPYTPPSQEGEAPRLPQFQEIKRFREEYGLDLDLKGNKLALDERIFELINSWNAPNSYLGAVARASTEQWGMPLRPVDVAELEYRERYVEEDGPLIEEWALEHHPTTYAGYEIDQRAGGLLRIGFTENQQTLVSELLGQLPLMAADRIAPFSITPTKSIGSLEQIDEELLELVEADPQMGEEVAGIEFPESGNRVIVEATNATAVESYLRQNFSSLAGVMVVQVSGLQEPALSRERVGGRLLAGDRVWNDWTPTIAPDFSWATAGFGAEEGEYISQEKRYVQVPFMLDAGHTGNLGSFMYRESDGSSKTEQERREHGEKIGRVGRDALTQGNGAIDALAVRLNSDGLTPLGIFGNGPTGAAASAHLRERVCTSGAWTERTICGRVIGFNWIKMKEYPNHRIGEMIVKGDSPIHKGDSGGPVWAKHDGSALGLMSAYPNGEPSIWDVQPLLTTTYGDKGKQVIGALNASVMGSGSLRIAER